MTISTVIPHGKNEETIERCINSVLNQTKKADEIILIINGNIPESKINEIRKRHHKHATIIALQNCRNANIARNIGIFASTSKYIAFLDSDDWWETDHIEKSIKILEAEDIDIVYSGMLIHYPNGIRKTKISRSFKEEETIEDYLLEKNPAPTSSLIAKRTVFDKVTWDTEIKRHQDYLFLSQASKIFKIGQKSDITVNYEHSNKSRKIPNIEDAFRVLFSFKNNTKRKIWLKHYFYLLKHLPASFSLSALLEAVKCLMPKRINGKN